MKTIIKEICIGVLSFVAVGLLLAIVFYDYVPIDKTIPSKKEYTVPEDIKTELGQSQDITVQSTQPQKITYSVTSSDLEQYQSATVYQPGNPNPFLAYSTGNNNNAIVDGTPSNTTTITSSSGIQYYYPQTSSTK